MNDNTIKPKFCPNCGIPLEGKLKCDCGYDIKTGIVDEKIYKKYKEHQKKLYEQQKDIMPVSECDFIMGARKMGVESSITDEDLINQLNQPIFNKENDFIIDSSKIIEQYKKEN